MKPAIAFSYLALIGIKAITTLNAQNISASISKIDHTSYAGVASQFVLTDLRVDGKTFYNGSGYLFCADYEGKSLDQDGGSYPRIESSLTLGKMEDMEVWNRFNNTQDEAAARSMANWFIDNYYESSFLQPVNEANARQYAFQNVLWEIFGDGGTAEGLNFIAGNINRSKFSSTGDNSSPRLWGHMNSMLNAVKASGAERGYVSKHEIFVALDPRESHQDYLMLAGNPELMAVPEPSALLTGLMGGVLLLRRRRD